MEGVSVDHVRAETADWTKLYGLCLTPINHCWEKPMSGKRRSVLQEPPSRREALLFGILLLSIVWLMMQHWPERVISVPDLTTRTTALV